jgi:hypothetical protein
MQGTVSTLRTALWDNLKVLYDRFPTEYGEMKISTV